MVTLSSHSHCCHYRRPWPTNDKVLNAWYSTSVCGGTLLRTTNIHSNAHCMDHSRLQQQQQKQYRLREQECVSQETHIASGKLIFTGIMEGLRWGCVKLTFRLFLCLQSHSAELLSTEYNWVRRMNMQNAVCAKGNVIAESQVFSCYMSHKLTQTYTHIHHIFHSVNSLNAFNIHSGWPRAGKVLFQKTEYAL